MKTKEQEMNVKALKELEEALGYSIEANILENTENAESFSAIIWSCPGIVIN